MAFVDCRDHERTQLLGDWTICSSPATGDNPIASSWRRVEIDCVVHALLVDARTRRVCALYEGSPSPEVLDHCLHHLILPRLVALDGHLVLHGSLVSTAAGLIGFIGASGQGKSTLAASLDAQGKPLLTDDAFQLKFTSEGWRAECIYPSLRLFPDVIAQLMPHIDATVPVAGHADKRTVPFAPSQAGGPIAAVFRLADDDDVIRITRARPAEACMALIANAFALEAGEPDEAGRRFKQASHAASVVPVYNLHYPRDFNRLRQVHDAIFEAMGRSSCTGKSL